MKIGARNLLLFLRNARKTANTMKVFDGLTLNADAFVWLRELVAHRAREILILQETRLPSPAVKHVLVWRSLQHLKKGRHPRVVLSGMRHFCKN